ncbi:MAG: insulinase family protein [Gemmatimonadaceae bacterium]|nr:insulinase family protein [Gemmatimonadaceae bacterium]
MSRTFARRAARLALTFALLLTLPAFALAQLPAGITKGATVEGITEYNLANGLKVLLFPDASKPTTTVNITYLVGSRHEGYGETGMAHLLEHLAFKGTPKHKDIPQELTEHGARPNGSTWYDRTNYFETVPATDSNLVWALDLEADRMVNSYIAKKDLESEFTVVRNEFEMGENDPLGILMERAMSTAYLWHNYGKSTIGARADIENVPIERLKAFYQKYYQPDNAVLVVAGKFDGARTLQLIADKFGAIPKPVRSLDRGNMIFPTYTAEPTQDGERSVTLRRVGDVQATMALYHIPAGTDKDYAAVDVLTRVLGDQPAGRIYKNLVEKKLAADASAVSFQFKEPGVFVAYANVRLTQSLDSAAQALRATLDGVTTSPPTKEEVERAKTTLLKQIDLALNNSEQVGLELSEWASMGDWRMMFIHRDRIKAVTPEDVQRVAKAYFKQDNRTVGTFIPTAKPDRAEIHWVTDAEIAAATKDYKGTQTLAEGEVFDPSTTNVEKRTTRSTLANGFKLALLPKQTRGNTVNAQLNLRYGDEKSLTGRTTASQLLGEMLDKGTKTKTRQQIKDEFDRLKARVNIGGAGNNIVVNLETTRPNLLPTLRLIGEVLKQPAFDSKEFELLRTENLAGLEQNKSEPMFLASVAMQRAINPWPKGHPLYVGTVDEQIADLKAVKLDDVKKVYTDLVGASYGDLAMAGDFDRDSVTAVMQELLGSWKNPKPFARMKRKFFDVAANTETIETPDKANALWLSAINLPVRDDEPEYASLSLGNYILGGGFLNSRLAVRIRQKDGLSYGVGSAFGAQALDSVAIIQTYAIYNPENVVRLESAFGEEIGRWVKEGVTADELEKAKQAWLQARLQARARDAELVNRLSQQSFQGRTMAFDQTLEDRVAKLSLDEVNSAIKKFVNPAKFVVVKAGDFKGKPPKPMPVKP